MKLYETLVATLQEKAIEDPTYLAFYTEDLLSYDKDIIENDAQRGDVYISVLKGNGCGTYILLCDCTNDHRTQRNAAVLDESITASHHPSKYFSVVVTGINEGTVEEINEEEARRLISTVGLSPYREPRRTNANSQICKLIACSEDAVHRVSSALSPYLETQKGQSYVVKLVAERSWRWLNVEVTPKKGENAGVTKTVNLDLGLDSMMRFDKPSFAKIDCTSDSNTDIKILDEKAFKRAYKSFQPKINPSSSLELNGF